MKIAVLYSGEINNSDLIIAKLKNKYGEDTEISIVNTIKELVGGCDNVMIIDEVPRTMLLKSLPILIPDVEEIKETPKSKYNKHINHYSK
jgi:hypothetical protein